MLARIRYVSLGLTGVVLVVALWISGVLDNSYVFYPTVQDPESGRIVSYHVKNIVVYLTERQIVIIYFLRIIEACAAAVILGLIISQLIWPARRNR